VTTTLRETGVGSDDHAVASSARPVLLATLDAPLLAEASRMAVETAVESGQALLVVNSVEVALTRCSLTFGHGYIAAPPVEESLNVSSALAHSLGVQVERICLHSPRPVEALLELTAEREAGLLVVGADPSAMRKRRYGRCVRKLVERSSCLVWVP
jgi:nucleotide-binding universal stress UspA family protein